MGLPVPRAKNRFRPCTSYLSTAVSSLVPTVRALLGSDLRIIGPGTATLDAGATRSRAEILQRHAVQLTHRLFLQFEPERPHDLMSEGAAGRVADRILGGFQPAPDPHDGADAD